jgi:DNA invertase Pin-like site-specific DNA recombinase
MVLQQESSVQQAVAYYRVSTQQQGKSGLGLEAQRGAVERFAKAEGFAVVQDFIEIESGANDERPQLLAAMAEARRLRCPLLVNKLDRLGRDVNHLTGLWKFGKVQIIITELGLNAEPVLIEMMAVIAAQERRMISRRTKAALAAAKARGVRLGGFRPNAGAASKAEALSRAEALRPIFEGLHDCSHRGAARALNERGVKTAQGDKWTAMQVMRVRRRLNLVA